MRRCNPRNRSTRWSMGGLETEQRSTVPLTGSLVLSKVTRTRGFSIHRMITPTTSPISPNVPAPTPYHSTGPRPGDTSMPGVYQRSQVHKSLPARVRVGPLGYATRHAARARPRRTGRGRTCSTNGNSHPTCEATKLGSPAIPGRSGVQEVARWHIAVSQPASDPWQRRGYRSRGGPQPVEHAASVGGPPAYRRVGVCQVSRVRLTGR